ncbi:drug/metabolite transporter (DMT)-like permease [Aequitasia blattaphilus]|uniref:DMT family transporter n=1 Tax=Aequitasia blattaphilus TaxID=2949332 RepID=A0ABT1E536_9FIRM|nr:DMT family transporter [Aequitasia blattaphilus]MCP1100945.1 DMT family transporter [Aequitasia blattaphilus]MCR8613585.1 DMT family transporter [Aequitasia blattaphilus]
MKSLTEQNKASTKRKSGFTNPVVIFLLASLCCCLWGSAFPAIKIGYQWFQIKGAGSQILFAGYRFLLAGIIVFVIGSILEKRVLRMKPSSIPYIFGQGLLQTTLQYICFYIGLAHTTGAKGSIINATNGFVSIIVAHFLLKSEKMTGKKVIGCIFGLLGVIVVNLSSGEMGGGFAWNGEGLILLCSILYGTSTVTLKMISKKESPITITAFQLLFGSFLLIALGLILGGNVGGFTPKSALLFLYLGLLTAVAFSLWSMLLKYNPVGKVAIFGFTIPVFGVFLSGLLLGERILSVQNILALLMVSVGIVIVNREKN